MTPTRTRLLAVATAAVVGITGGVGTALATDRSDSGSSGPPALTAGDGSEDGSGDDPRVSGEPLLYVAGGVLHDGERTVTFEATGTIAAVVRREVPTAVARRDGGYVLALPSQREGAEDLFSVSADGEEIPLGSVAEGWDLDLTGTRLVAHDVVEDSLTVYDTATGEPVTRWDRAFDEGDSAAYAGAEDVVLVSTRTSPSTQELFRWDVAAGTSASEGLVGFADMVASPEGSYVAGRVGPDGSTGADSGCLGLHETRFAAETASWQTCDQVPFGGGRLQFSPDGTRLLAQPAPADGAGPGSLVVIGSAAGPDTVIASFELSTLADHDVTFGGAWADDDSVWVTGEDYAAGASTSWVERCDLRGGCTEVVAEKTASLVLARVR